MLGSRVRDALMLFKVLNEKDTSRQENPRVQTPSVAATKAGSSCAMTRTGNVTLPFFKGCRPDLAANSTPTCREISRIRWIMAKIAVEEAEYRLTEVARYLSREPRGDEPWVAAIRTLRPNGQDIPKENWCNPSRNPKGNATVTSKRPLFQSSPAR